MARRAPLASPVAPTALAALAALATACSPASPEPTTPAAPSAAPPASTSAAAPPPAAPRKPAKPVSLASTGLDQGALDKSVAPCDDFFQYACGGWLAKTEIPADRSRWSRGFSEIQKQNEATLHQILEAEAKLPPASKTAKAGETRGKLGEFYGACLDEEAAEKDGLRAIEPLRKRALAAAKGKALDAALAELHKHRVFAFFEITDDQDFKDATKVIATIDQAGLGLPDRDDYLQDDDKSKKLRETYLGHVERMLALAGRKPADAKAKAADIVALETRLAKASKTRVERRDPKGLYNRLDRAGLEKALPSVDWSEYFRGLGFPDLREINVTAPHFLEAVDAALKETKPDVLQAYLEWHVLRSFAPTLTHAFVDEAFAMEKAVTGQAEQRARWKRCVDATDGALGELLAQKFVAKTFGADQKKAVEDMVFQIRDAFGKELDKLDWMDAPTRAKAHDKLREMAYLIGFPPKWRTYDFDTKGSYAHGVREARAWEERRRLAKIGKPLDREEWQMTPPTVNAYYDPLKNHMVFPAGILQPPFYGPKQSVPVNAGAIGMVVGHELTHGFDDEGSQFDGKGNLSGWWSDASRKSFDERAACVANQYDRYEPLPGVHLNGKLTLGENIADIGGIKLAFRAYQAMRAAAPEEEIADGYTEDQQFFLSVGQAWCTKAREEIVRLHARVDPHSPPKFRVNGALSDLPEFARAFSCAPASPMSPANACVVW